MKNNKLKFLLVVSLVIVIFGCQNNEEKISALQRKTAELEKSLDSLCNRVKAISDDASLDKLLKELDGIAYLTPGSEGVSVIQTDLGKITVSIENIQPYANGSRVTLTFGNLTSATINDVKATLEWGSVNEKGYPLKETTKTREFKFSKSLSPGSWNKVTIVLEGIPPSSFGFVRIRDLTNSSISLLNN